MNPVPPRLIALGTLNACVQCNAVRDAATVACRTAAIAQSTHFAHYRPNQVGWCPFCVLLMPKRFLNALTLDARHFPVFLSANIPPRGIKGAGVTSAKPDGRRAPLLFFLNTPTDALSQDCSCLQATRREHYAAHEYRVAAEWRHAGS